MKRNILVFVPRQAIRCLWACMLPMVAAALLAGCSKADDLHELPPGKYPISFAATVEGLTVQKAGTRATGKDAWEADDQVSISTHADGSSPKTYKITDASTGAMTPDNTGDVLYWQLSKNQPIRAWYPATDVTNADISDQSGGYAAFDYLTLDGTYDFAPSVSLSFRHQMAKVKYTLQKGEAISDDEFSTATVQIYGFTKANFAGGTLTGNTPGWIMPYATDKEAIVVPQQMQGKQFIKVTIGTGDAARNYYYTPTGNDGNLAAGNQYTYNISVKKTGLEVTVENNGVQWTDNNVNGGDANEVSHYVITLPKNGISDVEVLSATGRKITGEADGNTYHLPAPSTTFSIRYTPSDTKKSLTPPRGMCDHRRTGDATTYTSTYTRVYSDITLTYAPYTEVGDFYYADGTWGANTTSATSATVIGVIFWLGDITGDNYGLLDSQFPNGTHGLVAALNNLTNPDNADEQRMAWTYSGTESVSDWLNNATWLRGVTRPSGFTSIQVGDKMQGYANTVALQQYNKTKSDSDNKRVKPIYALAKFVGTNAAPQSSSGWYWPSFFELMQMCWGQGNGQNTAGRNLLNTQFSKVGGQQFTSSPSLSYWSSTEGSNGSDSAWYVGFGFGDVYPHSKDGSEFLVRPVLAF